MKVTIYHNPRCSKSRQVLEMLRDKGIEPEIVEYLKTPLDRAALTALLQKMGVGPRELLRRGEAPYKELGLGDAKWTDEQLIGVIAEHPILMERPVMVSPKGAKLCRPVEVVNTLI
jgi:arsenate reductase